MRIEGTRLDQPQAVSSPVNLLLDQRGALPDRWVALSKLGHVWSGSYIWNTLGGGGIAGLLIDPLTLGPVTLDIRFEIKTSGFGLVVFQEDPEVLMGGTAIDLSNMNRNFMDGLNLATAGIDPTLGLPGFTMLQEYCGGWFPHIWEWRLNPGRIYYLEYTDVSAAASYVSMHVMFTEE